MKTSRILLILILLITLLSIIAAGVGLFYQNDDSAFSFTTIRGETVQMYGVGLYRFESMRDGVGFRGVDLFILLIALPLLGVSFWLAARGSLRGRLVLAGTLAYLLYNSASMTFGYAYNNLFLVYTALLTTTLWATFLVCASIDLPPLAARFDITFPRRAIAAFLFAVGISLILVWAVLDILPALLSGNAPALTGHTTLPTHALDMGIIAPLAFVAGALVLRRAPLGYLLASILLIVSTVLGASVLALSAAQVWSGVLTPGQIMTFVAPFVILTAFALWLTVRLLQSISPGTQKHAGKSKLRAVRI